LMHKDGNVLDFLHSKGKTEMLSRVSDSERYASTKLMNVLFSHELQRRVLGPTTITSNAVHPGLVNTEFILHFIPPAVKFVFELLFAVITTSPRAGAQTTLWALLDEEIEGVGGLYISDSRVAFASPQATDWTSARDLWAISETHVAQYLD
jgi:NAD(P)-dependent dehydrogenase (short-subunit alcohol dehydrogenase family)